jgi:xanthine dehydrogenase iron-sulfur cluster and FAD-binding subunit A
VDGRAAVHMALRGSLRRDTGKRRIVDAFDVETIQRMPSSFAHPLHLATAASVLNLTASLQHRSATAP